VFDHNAYKDSDERTIIKKEIKQKPASSRVRYHRITPPGLFSGHECETIKREDEGPSGPQGITADSSPSVQEQICPL
jgi:hypothetical protein